MATITMITSGKDGAGKSAVSALLAITMAKQGKKVLVVELDNDPGCMDVFTACAGSVIYDLGDIFSGKCKPREAIGHSSISDNLSVIYSNHKRSTFHLPDMRDIILELSADYDHVIVDTDCTDDVTDSIASIAMHSIVVSAPDPMSLRDTKSVCDRLYYKDTPDVRFLLNRVEAGYITSKVIKSLDYCIDAVGVRLIGVLPESDEIRRMLFLGKSFGKKSKIKTAFENIAARIEGEDRPLAISEL